MKLKKVSEHTYWGWHKGYAIWFHKRLMGDSETWAYMAIIRKRSGRKLEYVASEGLLGSYLRTLAECKRWAKEKIMFDSLTN